MKKLLYIFSAAAVLFAGCDKDTKVFDETPEERKSARITELEQGLISAPNGWKGSLTTTGKGGYGFYMTFDDKLNVLMVGDLNDESATKPATSSYRIKWVMNATLIFDTYNYISLLQDPSPSVYGGASGAGLRSDVEWEYIGTRNDTIALSGFKYKNVLFLVKATAEEKARYLGTAYKANIDAVNNFFSTKSNNYITVDGIPGKVEFVLDRSGKGASFQYIDDKGLVKQIPNKFNYTDVGINFAPEFEVNGVRFVSGKLENGVFVLYSAAGKAYPLAQNPVPIVPMPLMFAYNGAFKSLFINGVLPAGVTSAYNAAFNGAVAKMAASGRTLVDLKFTLTNSNTAVFDVRYNASGTIFSATVTFTYAYANGSITFTNPQYNGNWNTRAAQLVDLTNYLKAGTYKVDYVVSTNPNVTNLGGFYNNDGSLYFYGTLLK
ncbi:DUF4302 domain-containing protein [Chitinophaga lutea]